MRTSIIANLAMTLAVIAAFFAWRGGMFGGGTKKTDVDINVQTPATK